MTRRSALAAVGIAAVAAAGLAAMGRSWWCACGSPLLSWGGPWSWDIWSEHNSQHLVDPYAFTHVQHGVLFYLVLRLVLGARRADLRFGLALGIEALWEIVENTDAVIQRYRETTISLDYYGDSIANSLSDLAMCAIGFTLARKLPAWITVTGYVAVELGLLATIRDSLTLNVVMLVAGGSPLGEAIAAWQSGGRPGAGP
ncbi:MAG: DUF2585 family protein [Myxococcota bacterium]